MKVLVVSAVLFVTAIITSTSQASAIDGNWEYVSQSCLSGAAPVVSSNVPTIQGVLIDDTKVTIFGSMQTCKMIVGPMDVSISATQITPLKPKSPITYDCGGGVAGTDEVDAAGVVDYVRNGNMLTFSSKNTTQGACAAGDTEVTTFQLVP